MPVLESTDNITPRSVLRHRPIGDNKNQSGKHPPAVTSAKTPVVQRASRPRTRPADTQEDDDIAEWQRAEEDEKDQSQPLVSPVRRASAQPKKLPTTPLPKTLARKRWGVPHAHPLLYLGAGMLSMILMWMLLSSVIGWYNTTMDNIHYGYPRTYQTDAFVGHNETTGVPSHFIAINLHGHIEIIEMPGGDAAHARIYLGPQLYGTGADLVPVTLKFEDVNSDHLPDMIVLFQDTQIIFINAQGGFRALNPGEHYSIP
ncbi:MAG: hypothetical protein ABI406_04005 [Ktedonobacteraceae bacterium]